MERLAREGLVRGLEGGVGGEMEICERSLSMLTWRDQFVCNPKGV